MAEIITLSPLSVDFWTPEKRIVIGITELNGHLVILSYMQHADDMHYRSDDMSINTLRVVTP